MRVLIVCLLMSTPVFAQESAPVHPELAACKAQVSKLAEQVVAIRLEALVKSEEARAYDAAKKQRDALVPPAPQEAKK